MTLTLELAALSSDTSTRRALSDLSLSVAKSKKIVVVTGAGISCSCGIPDFRSSDGLYALVKERYPDVVLKGRDLFDASLFRDATSTAVFYTFIAQLKQAIDSAEPTPTHRFIKTLDTKKRLLRSYTQNIDGLEARAGLLGSSSQEAKSTGKGKYKIKTKDVRNVQLHGDIHRVRCMSCSAEYVCAPEHLKMFSSGTAPRCPECVDRSQARSARSARPTRIGTLRPAIVLYDEPHPLGDDIGAIQSADVGRKPDMLIIMGTSLKVHGLKKLVKDFAKAVHTPRSSTSTSKINPMVGKVVFVNKTPPGAEWADVIDYHVAGETDAWCEKVIEDWKKMRPADWQTQKTLVEMAGDVSVGGAFKSIKNVLTVGTKGKGKSGKNVDLGEEENIPPCPINGNNSPSGIPPVDMTPPPSPSKRGRASCHYSEVESSPSKRHLCSDKEVLLGEERKLLFTESTNNRLASTSITMSDMPVLETEVFDLSMQDVESKSKPRASKRVPASKTVVKPKIGRPSVQKNSAGMKKKIAAARKTKEVWVEIVKS